MSKPRWSLAGMFSLCLFAAIVAAGYRAFWSDQHSNAWLLVSIYLALLTSATLGAWRGWPWWRRPCMGYAAFGWINLAVVLRFGWNLETNYVAQLAAHNVPAGIVLGFLAGMIAAWLMPEFPVKE